MSLTVTSIEKKPGIFIVTPAGSIDSITYAELEKKIEILLNPAVKVLILNMAGVSYISSAGLSVIFKTRKFIEHNGGFFLMTDLQPQVKKVFDVIKALPNLNVFASIEEADQYLSRVQRGQV